MRSDPVQRCQKDFSGNGSNGSIPRVNTVSSPVSVIAAVLLGYS